MRLFDTRIVHYALVVLVSALLTFPSLGTTSLWDIDEGLNAEAAREMLESDNWIVPQANYKPRTAKPALLYWLQAMSYQRLGVNEFAARLPSALASIIVALCIYELGRRMFDARTGLYAGLIVASSIQFCLLAHAATPDMLLLAGVVLAMALFWFGYTYDGYSWLVTAGIGTGIAMLAKGPVGLALPSLVIGMFLFSRGELKRFFNWRLGLGVLGFALIALPWYILVGSETRGAFLRSFFWNENVNRFVSPMEAHAGPIYFYLLVFFVGFAPWCIFTIPTLINGWREARGEENKHRLACRFLLLWAGIYLAFFSAAATKLPNYVLPIYPAFALLTARMLRRWQIGEKVAPDWMVPACTLTLSLVGLIAAAGLVIASGVIALPQLKGNIFPGLERWAIIGAIPVVAAILAWRSRRSMTFATVCTASVAFLTLVLAFPVRLIDASKAPKQLVETAKLCQPEREMRIAALEYFQPSLVFYAQREVAQITDAKAAIEFLESPMASYLICPAKLWDELAAKAQPRCSVLARRRDLYRNYDVVVVGNQAIESSSAKP